ncbi:MAG TPA: transglutaminase-like domain-containing protein, partial [Candidatus Ozemobacteraceae bacterium]|nr:transglutaminase-like domain-containing protein [Candidatus Ozemobacteraceae bacterium]
PSPARASAPDADERLTFVLPEEANAATVFLRLGYDIQLTPWLVSRGQFLKERAPDLDSLQRMPGLSLDDPLLEQLHLALKGVPGNGLQNLYLAVSRGLSYKENFEDHPVSWALENPHLCDCTEYSYLLAALCLKRSIPARVVTGFLIKPDLLDRETNVGHAWVETYFPDKGWVPVDPTLAANMRWAYFGNLLSDQILFERPTVDAKARVSVDVTSTRNDLSLKISSSFLCSLIN